MIESVQDWTGRLLKSAEDAFPRVKWHPLEDGPKDHDAKFFKGESEDGWVFTVVSFDLEHQGQSAGTRSYDGTGFKGLTVIRLTWELAEKAYKIADQATSTKEGKSTP